MNPSVNPLQPADTQADGLILSSRERQTHRINQFLANARPSSRQLEELQALGYSGVLIASMLEASELIASLTKTGGRK